MKKQEVKTTREDTKAPTAIDERSEAINATLGMLQGKAKPSILAYLASGKKRLTHISEEMKGINARDLSSELKVLEKNALIRKIEVGTMPVIIEYEITPEGQSLKKILDELHQWSLAKRKKEAAQEVR
ncbi:MAG: transcriptional regulator [Azospira oryzae]|jgi:DNA-binding HxlR family transcriptional regulator|nr:transcriptional regulator [Cytophaga sp.]PZR38800.1 MAG: transcriptional regulator [Azospira oryzae]